MQMWQTETSDLYSRTDPLTRTLIANDVPHTMITPVVLDREEYPNLAQAMETFETYTTDTQANIGDELVTPRGDVFYVRYIQRWPANTDTFSYRRYILEPTEATETRPLGD